MPWGDRGGEKDLEGLGEGGVGEGGTLPVKHAKGSYDFYPQLWSDLVRGISMTCTLIIYSTISFNLYHSLGIFSRRQIDDIFLIFPRKQDLTFHANCLLRRQFA